jgi:hypothetical protein
MNAHALAQNAAQQLNRDCYCRSVDHEALRRALESGAGEAGSGEGAVALSYDVLRATHANLFSDVRVHVAQSHLDFMSELVRAVERVVALPAWQETVLAYAPQIARHPTRAAGVMLGYDFHLDADGPRLIEINTNAGGALLNTRLLAAQRACSAEGLADASEALLASAGRAQCADSVAVEAEIVAMFRAEWALWTRPQAGDGASAVPPLGCIAIVDETPQAQFLAPEFELFRQLFVAHGIACVIADPRELVFDGEALRHAGRRIDLVYNRLTDFAFDEPASGALRAAYLGNKVAVTPHPRAHALYADKRNLVALSDDTCLQALGVDARDRDVLARGVPATRAVTPDNADAFWVERKQWFFKPRAGYGSRAAYRGDKLTKRVFAEIAQGQAGGYIAQALVRPSERWLRVDGVEQPFKVDLRNYVYRDRVQLVSARLYQGQTTNFRTPGGGFAAVYAVR